MGMGEGISVASCLAGMMLWTVQVRGERARGVRCRAFGGSGGRGPGLERTIKSKS